MAKKKDTDETAEEEPEPKQVVPHSAEALEQLTKDQRKSQDAYRDTGPNLPG
ncbi:MAG TPA: hypothetical protein VNM34_03640 [Verrucomicrobiae bacterium]|nr:hypothetical protein [Verrucomicrobiae bacterium]